MLEYFNLTRATVTNMAAGFDPNTSMEEKRRLAKEEHERLSKVSGFECTERTKEYEIPGYQGEKDAPNCSFKVSYPTDYKAGKRMPCAFMIPGGGLKDCMDISVDSEGAADTLGAICVVPHYRVITDENGFYPAAINDLHNIYTYIVEHSKELGIKAKSIVLTGASAGGHLTLSLAHRLKNHGIVPRGCVAICPVPDERAIFPCSKLTSNMVGGNDVYAMGLFWLQYMPSCDVPAEAFANHATVEECIGLPPTIIHTAELDPCVDPCLQYTSKLIEAGVFTSIRVWGGAGHEINASRGEGYPERIHNAINDDIKDLFKFDHRRPWTVTEEF